MPAKTSTLWIDWARNLRTHSLAQRLGVEILEIRVGGNRLRRYLTSARRTLAAIRAQRPAVVIATNPSLVLSLLLLALRRWYGFALVSDAHYVGVEVLNGERLLQRALDFHNARAELVIVTNPSQAARVTALGGRAYICPDPLPDLSTRTASVVVPEKAVFLICSFERDEPFTVVFEAFKGLQQAGYTLFVSGRYARAQIDPAHFPWVRFLGYVSVEDYYAYLKSCAVVVDLTQLENCLLCGAYEALAAHRPLVISNTRALAGYFGAAAILTENTPEAVGRCVQQAYEMRASLESGARAWVAQNELYMEERIGSLREQLRLLSAPRESSSPKARRELT